MTRNAPAETDAQALKVPPRTSIDGTHGLIVAGRRRNGRRNGWSANGWPRGVSEMRPRGALLFRQIGARRARNQTKLAGKVRSSGPKVD